MGMNRTESCMQKVERIHKALRHEEPDRVPITDFFWGSFIRRWRQELNLPPDANPYEYYDLDWIVTLPNMDPHIKSFEIIDENADEITIKTGFETVVRKKYEFPMPEMIDWDTDSIEKLEALEFDDPCDRRRYLESGDNHIAGVGDGFERNSIAWIEDVKKHRPHRAVFGSIIECSECLTRLIGQENTLLWMGMYPERMGKAIHRIGQFYLDCVKEAIRVGDGLLDGFLIWGDVAYKKSLLFSPAYWREHFKPWVKAMADHCHEHGLPVMYHGCGNVNKIFEDFIEIGIDAYNPLEVKAGMDVIELRKTYGHRIGFFGNNDIQVWESGNEETIRNQVLTKLNAAKGGGYIFASDHSVSSAVSGKTYDSIVNLVRDYGDYPLQLGAWDISL